MREWRPAENSNHKIEVGARLADAREYGSFIREEDGPLVRRDVHIVRVGRCLQGSRA